CPRVICQSQPLRPAGVSDIPYEKSVKLYCGHYGEVYSPESSRHRSSRLAAPDHCEQDSLPDHFQLRPF
ncbi:hypothetical protein PAXINDRAFT_88262, partial [Paxillus involutus ATCC 200175]